MTTATENSKVVMDYATASAARSDVAQRVRALAEAKVAEGRKQGGIKDLTVSKKDIYFLNPYNVRVKDGWNSRDPNDPKNAEHIDALARSIAEVGVQEPLTVFWEAGAPTLSDGHCRLFATFRAIEVYGAEVLTVPVKTEDKHSSEADRLASQIIRNSGKPLSALEMATVAYRLKGLGWSEKQIAAKAGMSPSRVGQLLELHAAPADVKARIAAGEVSATLVRDVMRHHKQDGAAAAAAIEEAVTKAKTNGKGKATAKDAGIKKTASTTMQELRAIFTEATINDTPKKGQPVTIALTPDAYERLREVVGF